MFLVWWLTFLRCVEGIHGCIVDNKAKKKKKVSMHSYLKTGVLKGGAACARTHAQRKLNTVGLGFF